MERKITIEEESVYSEDYQMRMLRENRPEGLLAVNGRGINGTSFYDYNVSGKISMQAMYERTKISADDLKMFLRQLLSVIRETEKYLLNIHCILLEQEYIFYEDEKFYFCYYPCVRKDLWEEFHKLTEYFVKQADYEDRECVRMVFILHKETMEENYSLEKIVRECLETGKGAAEEEEKEEKRESGCGIYANEIYNEEEETDYDTEQHDWIRRQHHGQMIMEETQNMWTPVKRFLNRRKKAKWGDWDGLYIEEEDI